MRIGRLSSESVVNKHRYFCLCLFGNYSKMNLYLYAFNMHAAANRLQFIEFCEENTMAVPNQIVHSLTLYSMAKIFRIESSITH